MQPWDEEAENHDSWVEIVLVGEPVTLVAVNLGVESTSGGVSQDSDVENSCGYVIVASLACAVIHCVTFIVSFYIFPVEHIECHSAITDLS